MMKTFTFLKSKISLALLVSMLMVYSADLSAQSYRYYRITLNSGNSLELADVRWMNGSTERPSNQSNGSAVTASNNGWWNVFDSDRSAGAWIGTATGSEFITIDLGSAVSISGVKLQLASWSGALIGFTCAGSNNNSSFTNLYTTTAINQSGSSAVTYNFTTSDTQAPTVPSGLVSSSITSSSFNLTWSASTDNVGVTGYEVFRNGTSVGTPASTNFSVTGLSATTTYSMTVRARDAAGNWSATSALSVTTSAASDTQAPTVPSGLVSSSITSNSFNLTWAASTDNVAVTVYEVFRNGTSVGTPTTTNFSATALSASTTYSMTVRARDAAGNWSAASSALSVTTSAAPDTQAPTVPSGLVSSSITSSSFNLTWSASTDNVGVTGYEVFRNGTSVGTPASTNFSVTGLSASTAYSMTVRARDAAGNWSATSSALSVTTSASGGGGSTVVVNFSSQINGNLPNPYNDASGYSFTGSTSPSGLPEALVVQTISGNKAIVNTNWASKVTIARTGGGSFNLSSLKYASSPWGDLADATVTGQLSGGGTVSANISSSSLTFATATLNWTNLSQVVVDYTGGTNDSYGLLDDFSFGSSVADTQAPTVPTGLASSLITSSSFTLSWTASTDNVGVPGYEVFRNGTSVGTPTSTNFLVNGLSASTNYSMTVRARDAAGNWSAISSALNITTAAATGTQVTGVTLSPTTLSINVGASSQLTATVTPSNATNKTVSWTSSNNSVATVSSSGVVNGVAAGNATITVTTQDQNKTATAAVTVSNITVPAGNLLDPNATPSVVALWNYLKSIYGLKC